MLAAVALVWAGATGIGSRAADAHPVLTAVGDISTCTGTGDEATAGKLLTVHYTGWLYNSSAEGQKGAQFDSSAGQPPFIFSLGVGQVIEGWDRGLVGMKAGGLRRLVIPPSLFLLDDRVFMSLGVLRVAAVLEAAGSQVDVLDLSGVKDFTRVIADYAAAEPTRLFGLTATTPQLPPAVRILEALRAAGAEHRIPDT